jgi:DNA-binding NtrC family response regulator
MIVLALGETRGDKVAAARILGIGKTTIYRLLKEDKELEARLAAQVFN